MPSTGTSGKAARLVLRRRLEVARRGADLLSRKRQALLAEQRRLRDAAAAAAAEWAQAVAEAERWLVRSALLDDASETARIASYQARARADGRLGAADGHRPTAHRRPRAGPRAADLLARRELGSALHRARLPPRDAEPPLLRPPRRSRSSGSRTSSPPSPAARVRSSDAGSPPRGRAGRARAEPRGGRTRGGCAPASAHPPPRGAVVCAWVFVNGAVKYLESTDKALSKGGEFDPEPWILLNLISSGLAF